MPTISWIIERLLVKPTEGSLTDVVITADWRCNGSETIGTGDDAKTYRGTAYGSSNFNAPSGAFTPYPDLKPEQILGWVFAGGVDQKAIEANVTLQIENQIDPPVICLPLPWAAQPSSPPVPPAPEVVVVAPIETVVDAAA